MQPLDCNFCSQRLVGQDGQFAITSSKCNEDSNNWEDLLHFDTIH
jgi:hypothetical protein